MSQNRRPVGQQRQQEIEQKPKRKKFRKFRAFLLFLLLLIVAIGAYAIFQFKAGVDLAEDGKIEAEPFTPDQQTGDIENYLLLGVDARGEEQSRTDTMMILSWNHQTDEMKLVSLMRDIYAEIPGYRSYKLNTAYYLGGVELLKETIRNMFDVPIHHYALIDFKNFESMIDILAPNGIEIDVEKDMSQEIGVELKQGIHYLNGKELLGYARFRKDADGDFGRVARQQKVIQAVKDQVLSVQTLKNIPKFVGATQGYIATDITNTEKLSAVTSIMMSGGVEIDSLTIPQQGEFRYNSYQHAGSVIELDINKTKQTLHNFLNLNE